MILEKLGHSVLIGTLFVVAMAYDGRDVTSADAVHLDVDSGVFLFVLIAGLAFAIQVIRARGPRALQPARTTRDGFVVRGTP